MSRHGYNEELDQWDLIRWRGAVASALRGRRGQAFLREMLAALDALPTKRLIAYDLQNTAGEVCALGAVCVARKLDVATLDPEEPDDVSAALNLADAMVREIAFENDEHYRETPEQRWQRMRDWVAGHIREA